MWCRRPAEIEPHHVIYDVVAWLLTYQFVWVVDICVYIVVTKYTGPLDAPIALLATKGMRSEHFCKWKWSCRLLKIVEVVHHEAGDHFLYVFIAFLDRSQRVDVDGMPNFRKQLIFDWEKNNLRLLTNLLVRSGPPCRTWITPVEMIPLASTFAWAELELVGGRHARKRREKGLRERG